MAWRMVRFVPRVERGGLGRDDHREQQQDEQGSTEGPQRARRLD